MHTEDYDPTSTGRTELSLVDLGFELPVSGTDAVSGWSNGTSYGDPDAALDRVVAHWFNLPAGTGLPTWQPVQVMERRYWWPPDAVCTRQTDGRSRWTFAPTTRPSSLACIRPTSTS